MGVRLGAAIALAIVAGIPIGAAGETVPAAPYVLVDDSGGPIAAVDIAVVGRTGSARTASDGTFVLHPDPIRPFDLVVFDRAGEVLGTVRVGPDDGPAVVLVPQRVETVRVVSGVAPSTEASPAAAATVLSREETERIQPSRLADVLAEVPGAEAIGSGQSAVPAVRGLSRGRTLILLDDARVTAERRAGPSATYLNPFALQNVEIVRGPGSVAYGSDAIGGVIHARTPRPRPDEFSGRWEAAGGAGVPFGSLAVETNVPVGRRSAMLVQAHGREYGDYSTPERTEPNSSARGSGALIRGAVDRDRVRVAWGVQVDRGRDLERPASDTFRRVNRYPEEDSDRVTFAVETAGNERWTGAEVHGFLGRYRLVTERETFATSTAPTTVATSVADANDASVRAIAGRRLSRGTLRFGVDASSRFGLETIDRLVERPAGAPEVVVLDETTIESARRIDLGAFVEVEHPVGGSGTTLSGGVRVDRVATRNDGGYFGDRSTADAAPAGFVAVRVPLGGGWDASVQAARGFRAPTLSDRYFRGTTARGTITGNPDLEAETSRQFDLAVRGGTGRVRVGAFAYAYRIRDLIERYESAPDQFAFRNRAEQELVGAELELDVVLGPTLAARAGVQCARGEILDDGTPAADVPAPAAVLTLDHRPAESWWWRVAVHVRARDDRPGEQEAVTPGVATVDLAAGWRPTERLELRLLVDNVFDRAYPWSADDSTPLAPGRSFAVAGSGRF